MAMIEPLTLSIMRTIQEFKKIPMDLLARRVHRTREEVEEKVTALQKAGVVSRHEDIVMEDNSHEGIVMEDNSHSPP